MMRTTPIVLDVVTIDLRFEILKQMMSYEETTTR
jgi:hypothetical protein